MKGCLKHDSLTTRGVFSISVQLNGILKLFFQLVDNSPVGGLQLTTQTKQNLQEVQETQYIVLFGAVHIEEADAY